MADHKRPESMERITTPALAEQFIAEQVAAVRAQVGDCLLYTSGVCFQNGKAFVLQIDFHQIGNFPFIVYNKNSLLHDNNSFYMGFQRENGF